MFVAVLICYTLISFFFYSETKGYGLEQMSFIFNREEAAITGLPGFLVHS